MNAFSIKMKPFFYDCIFAGPSSTNIDDYILELTFIFNLTDEGKLLDYLGIKINQLPDRQITHTYSASSDCLDHSGPEVCQEYES